VTFNFTPTVSLDVKCNRDLYVTAQTKNYPHKGTEDTALGTILKADHNSFAIIQVKNDKTNHR